MLVLFVVVLFVVAAVAELWKGYAAARREELLFLLYPGQEMVLTSSPLAVLLVLVFSI